jgi:hypothetical protein
MTCSGVAVAVNSQQKQRVHSVTLSGVEVVIGGQLLAGNAAGSVWSSTSAASSCLVLAVLLAMVAWNSMHEMHRRSGVSAEQPDAFTFATLPYLQAHSCDEHACLSSPLIASFQCCTAWRLRAEVSSAMSISHTVCVHCWSCTADLSECIER